MVYEFKTENTTSLNSEQQAVNSIKKLFADFSELVMFKHSIFSLPFIFIAMLVASYHINGKAWFGWKLLFLGTLAAVTARNFAMGVNRLLDRDIDLLNPRTNKRPSVDGRVSKKEMLVFILLNALFFVITAYLINTLSFILSFPILVILGLYSYFKRFSAWAHIVLGISLGLAPVAGVVAVSSEVTLWSFYLATGVVFWVAGFDLLYSLQDIAFDKAHSLHSIPSKYGVSKTMHIAVAFHLLTIGFWILFVSSAGLGIWAKTAVLLSLLMLGYEHYLVRKDFNKINKAFFVVNGYLGFMFILFIIIDLLR